VGGRGPVAWGGGDNSAAEERLDRRGIDWHPYRARGVVEWLWSKVEPCRRVATRYEERARDFLAFVQVTSVMAILR